MTLKNALLASTAAALLLGAALPASADGTAVSTSVTNSVDLSYDSGTTPISTPNAASDTFVVDEKVSFTLVAQDGTSVSVNPAEPTATLTFLFTNTGNVDLDFDLDVAQSDNGDPIGLTYDAANSGAEGTWSIYTSPNATGGPDTPYDQSGINGFSAAVDEQVYIKIIAHIPDDAMQDEEDVFDLSIRALDDAGTGYRSESTVFGNASLETVFADAGFDGLESATEYFTVDSAIISATKTVAIASENRDGTFLCTSAASEGGDAFIPGACLDYVITLKNDAAAGKNADSFTFTDTLPAGVSFVITRDDSGFDSIMVDAGSGTITGTVYSLAPGEEATITIRAVID